MKQLLIILFFGLLAGKMVNAQTDTTVYSIEVQSWPRWPGCETSGDEKLAEDCWDQKLNNFLGENLEYPGTCMQITGKVWIEFIIEQNGTVTNLKIIRGVAEALDEEAMRVFKLLPVFSPARQNNQPVRFKYRLPINFTLK